MLYIVNLKYQ